MRTSFFVPVQANISNSKNGVSFKGPETDALRRIAKGDIGTHALVTLTESPITEKITQDLQQAFDDAYRSGKCRQTLDAYFNRKSGLKKPK